MGKAEAVRPVLSALGAAVNGLVAALLSPPCATCGCVVDGAATGAMCGACWRRVRTESAHADWPALPEGIDAAASLGAYEGTLRLAVHALKYDGRRSIAGGLARLLAERCGHLLAGADAVVPVPLHPLRRWTRGFNQCDELARHLRLPIWKVLRRVRHTPPQAGLTADRRLANLRLAFSPRAAGRPRRIEGRCLVLLDDVSTTGTTAGACGAVLKELGAAEIRLVTVARTPLRHGTVGESH